MYVVGIALGSLTTALIVGFWKPVAEEEVEDEIAEAAPTQAQAAPAAAKASTISLLSPVAHLV